MFDSGQLIPNVYAEHSDIFVGDGDCVHLPGIVEQCNDQAQVRVAEVMNCSGMPYSHLAGFNVLHIWCSVTNIQKNVRDNSMAYFYIKYQSDAKFADINAFYARVLLQQGWTPPK